MFVIAKSLKKLMATLTLAVMLTGFIPPMHAVAASDPTVGAIAVTVVPETGSYRVLDASGQSLSANPFVGSQTFTDVPQSSYTVVFLPIDGYDAPLAEDSKTVLVSPGATATASYTYKATPNPVNGTLKVTVTPETGRYDILLADGSKVENSPFTGSKELVLAQSTYTVAFLPIAGYDAPLSSDSKTVLVSPGLTTEASFTYAEMQVTNPASVNGILKVTVNPETGTYDVLRADGSKIENSPFTGSKELILAQSTYTVAFLPIAGYVAPATTAAKTVLVSPGLTTEASYTYKSLLSPVEGILKVTVTPETGKFDVLLADGSKVNATPFVGSQTFTEVPQSTYTVVFLPIDGHVAPTATDNKTVLVSPGLTTEASYTYKSLLSPVEGILKVTVTPETGKYDVLRADGSKIEDSPFTGSKELILAQSTYTVAFLPIDGYDAPLSSDSKTVLVSPGLTTEVSYTYGHSTQPSNTISVNLFDLNHNPVTDGQWVIKSCADSNSLSSCTTDFKSGTASLAPVSAPAGIYGIFASKAAYTGVTVLSANPQTLSAGGTIAFDIQYTSDASVSTATLSISANVASAPIFVDDFTTAVGNASPTAPVTKVVPITSEHTIRCGDVTGYTKPADIVIAANTLQKDETKVYSCAYTLTTLVGITKDAVDSLTTNNNKLVNYTVVVTNLSDSSVKVKLIDTISGNGKITSNGGELAAEPNTCMVDGTQTNECLSVKSIELTLDKKDSKHTITYTMRSNNAAQTVATAFSNTVTATYTNPNNSKEESVTATKSVLVDIPTPATTTGCTTCGGGGGGGGGGTGGGHTLVKGDLNLTFQKLVSLDNGSTFRDALGPKQALAIPENQATRLITKLTISNPGNVSVANLRLLPIFESGKSDMTGDKIQDLKGATLDNQGRILIEKITAKDNASISYSILVHENGRNVNPALEGLQVVEIGSTLPVTQDGLTYKNLGEKIASVLYAGIVPAQPRIMTDSEADFSSDSGLLSVRVNSDKSQVALGDIVNFTLTLRNMSDEDLTHLSLMQDIPAELSVLNSGGGINEGGQLTWKAAILRPGEQMTRHFQVKVVAGAPGNLIRSLTSVLMSEGEFDPVDSSLLILGGASNPVVKAYRLAQTGPGGILALLILSILSVLAFNFYGKRRNQKIRELALRPL